MDIERSRITQVEWTALAVIVVIGFTLRIAFPSRMSVEHFDEGVYASTSNSYSLYSNSSQFQYPERHLYSPPLMPWLIKQSIELFGPSRFVPMLVNIFSGSLTVALMWWVARRWFGRAAGLAAAILAAFSDLHLLYSRTALTDVLLCFFLLLAIYLIWEVFRLPRIGWMLVAGAITGLAWWTKYIGWLSLAIGLAGVLPWILLRHYENAQIVLWRSVRQLLLCWLAITLTACVAWYPVLRDLEKQDAVRQYNTFDHSDQTHQRPSGYAAVVANHRRFLVGFAGWSNSFQQQVAKHRHFDGWLTGISLGLALLVPAGVFRLSRNRFTWNTHEHDLVTKQSFSSPLAVTSTASIAMVAAACSLGSSVVLALLAVSGIMFHLNVLSKSGGTRVDDDTRLAGWLLAVWFGGLLISTPFYYPYPRLTLPWLVATWLGTAAALHSFIIWTITPPISESQRPPLRSRVLLVAVFTVSVGILLWSASELTSKAVPGWQSRTGLESMARVIVQDAKRIASELESETVVGIDIVLYVYAEPGLFFHLSEPGVVVQPTANLDFVHPSAPPCRVPTFLVVGHRSELYDELETYPGKFELIKTYRYRPSDLVLLNHYDPDEISNRPIEFIRVYLTK